MSYIDRSQPRERDDAPEFSLDRAPPPIHDDAPPLHDETDSARLAKLGRHVTEANKELMEALRLLAEGKHDGYAGALRRSSDLLTEAAALSRVLSRSHTAKR